MIIYLYLPLFCVSVERNCEWASLWRKWSYRLDHASSILSPAHTYTLELQTKVREYFTIMEMATSMAFSWLKAPTSARLSLWLWNHREPSLEALTHIHITNTSTLPYSHSTVCSMMMEVWKLNIVTGSWSSCPAGGLQSAQYTPSTGGRAFQSREFCCAKH